MFNRTDSKIKHFYGVLFADKKYCAGKRAFCITVHTARILRFPRCHRSQILSCADNRGGGGLCKIRSVWTVDINALLGKKDYLTGSMKRRNGLVYQYVKGFYLLLFSIALRSLFAFTLTPSAGGQTKLQMSS